MKQRKMMLRVCAFYSLLIWMYVVGFQYVYGWRSVYWNFATWIPIRTDYVGEASVHTEFHFEFAFSQK